MLLASDGGEALDTYNENKDRIDLIVLDIWMPRVSGSEFLDRIRKSGSETKVIVSTGHSEDYQRDELKRFGVSGYVAKPYRPLDLLHRVRDVLDAS